MIGIVPQNVHRLGNRMPPHLEPRYGPPPHTPLRRVLKLHFFPLNTIGTPFMKGKSVDAPCMNGKSIDGTSSMKGKGVNALFLRRKGAYLLRGEKS